MPALMNARYTSGTCRHCNGPIVEGQSIQFFRPINPGARGYSVHDACHQMARLGLTVPQYVAPGSAAAVVREDAQTQTTTAFAPIIEFMRRAVASGLRQPVLRFIGPDGRSELRLKAGRFGGLARVAVYYGRNFCGTITESGAFTGGRADIRETLTAIAVNPAAAAGAYGALTSRCSFCSLPLTDAGSVAVGYGPICAGRYNLPHSALGSTITTRGRARQSWQQTAARVAATDAAINAGNFAAESMARVASADTLNTAASRIRAYSSAERTRASYVAPASSYTARPVMYEEVYRMDDIDANGEA